MNVLSTAEIRARFLAFFEARDHRVVRSASLVPANDPTLLFTNAGMNQFKEVFLGREQRDYRRATSSQKCVRAGGKHNDLEVVGFTGRHHTFFEMLGNFSFGDYFKEAAIAYAWAFLTEELGIPEERLWVSVFRDDDEAEGIWLEKIGVPKDRVLRLGEKDNFWQMGETGPCGPCSEIHFDQGDGVPCPEEAEGRACTGVECECDRVLEVWNLVFMQFDRDAEGNLNPLPAPSIDTGMGLERVSAVVQGKTTNYEIDLLREIIATVESLSGKSYGEDTDDDVSMRVIADHARATTFLVGDGVLPAADGRGYVLRRIMRRAIRHGKRLGFESAFFGKVCEKVIATMGEAYPELFEQAAFILKVAEQEEAAFRRTLDRGLKLLEEALTDVAEGEVLSGEVAFKLYDTYGFPVDLTQVICQERGRRVDLEGFENALARQRASSEWKGSGESAVDAAYKALAETHGETVFTGYEGPTGEGRVLALLEEGSAVESAGAGTIVDVVLDRTPFYGESGGQVGDTGTLRAEGTELAVEDARKPAGLIVHRAKVVSGEIRVGQDLVAEVDAERRRRIKANHSATHMLHKVLKEVLGEHVKQAGSLVAPDLFRFDYTHFEAPTADELEEIERRVNDMVARNEPTNVKVVSFDEAREMGAVAMFGEKYGEVVRTVHIGGRSLELCGGTHVERAGDVGLFKIVSDASIASGVRRIVAHTQDAALRFVQDEARRLRETARVLKASPQEVDRKAASMQERLKELEREVDTLQKKLATARTVDVLENVREINGVKVLAMRTEVSDAKALRDLADRLRDRLGTGVVALGAEKDGKALLLVAVTQNLISRVRAADLVREIAPMVGGRGGGKPDMAQAGGDAPQSLDAALSRVYELIPAA
jgi:alanyl-tRNA synthetase